MYRLGSGTNLEVETQVNLVISEQKLEILREVWVLCNKPFKLFEHSHQLFPNYSVED
jgi:hypothetical protein